ncbi:PucR family transcriptional regulator [Kibdelosporangium aridum]|uniref:PucR family transcriptional regulator n=1 Tax=Kibdelosporangium aridum TaxID=2030 RepID=UPI00068DD058
MRSSRRELPDEGVAKLVAEAERRLPEVTDSAVKKVQAAMEVYRAGAVIPPAELRQYVEANLREIVHGLSAPGTPELTRARVTGKRRAEQGVPLSEVVRAFRIGFAEIWNVLVEEADRVGPDMVRTLVSAATTLWYLADDFAEAMSEAYRDTVAELASRQRQQRSALVEALFSGQRLDQAALWQISELLQMPIDGLFLVVAAESPELGEEALPSIESRLDAMNLGSAWRLTPETQVGVISLRSTAAQASVLDLLRRHATSRIGVSPAFSGLMSTPRALHFATVALASLPLGQPGVFQFDDSPLTALVASAPEEATQLAHQVLGGVLQLGDEGTVLLDTLQAWFDCAGSTKDTADRLFCHPNTVRYRLRRLQDLTGRSLTNPAHQAELLTGLRAIGTYPKGEPLA